MAILALRRLWRLSALIFPLTYYFANKTTTFFMCLVILAIFLSLELRRHLDFEFNRNFFQRFDFLLKEKEKQGLLTTTWFVFGVFLCVIFFTKQIAITAILFLIFGDMAANFFGLKFGKRKILNQRTLEGSLANFIVCLIIGIILKFTSLALPTQTIISGALAASLAEYLPLPIDDNFTLGLFSGIIMTLVSKVVA
ncbi:MAG: hypothetical protein NC928_01185 [Candidatus Omnitrophica bacterium]|nr:hypothetical protein [Candidatus Omnitrophota bacterium]